MGYAVHYELGYDVDAKGSVCLAVDECHLPGEVVRGHCSNPPRDWNFPCDDADPETLHDSCQAGKCTGLRLPTAELEPPSLREHVLFANTRSHGAGYFPPTEEYFFPQWSCCGVYRYDRGGMYTGQFDVRRWLGSHPPILPSSHPPILPFSHPIILAARAVGLLLACAVAHIDSMIPAVL